MTALKSVPTLLQGGITTVVLNSKENEDRALPEAPPKRHQAQNSSQTINRAWSSSEAIILSLDISYLQTSHPAGITLQSGGPRPQDFLDLDLDLDLEHSPLPAICRIS